MAVQDKNMGPLIREPDALSPSYCTTSYCTVHLQEKFTGFKLIQ